MTAARTAAPCRDRSRAIRRAAPGSAAARGAVEEFDGRDEIRLGHQLLVARWQHTSATIRAACRPPRKRAPTSRPGRLKNDEGAFLCWASPTCAASSSGPLTGGRSGARHLLKSEEILAAQIRAPGALRFERVARRFAQRFQRGQHAGWRARSCRGNPTHKCAFDQISAGTPLPRLIGWCAPPRELRTAASAKRSGRGTGANCGS